jgi:CheY-like chemotaxis protein
LSADKPKVLVSDDERVIADTLAIILNQHGYEALAVYTSKDQVEMARSFRPDFIISDVIKPDMDGIEAAILVRGFLPSCKILLFSGQAATADLLESARARGYEFEIFAKPVHPQDLLAWLRGDSVPYVARQPVIYVPSALPSPPPPIPIETPAKAVRLPAKKPEKTPITPFFAAKLIGDFLLKFALFVACLMVVFGILAFIGYGLDQVIVSARPHIQRQHYTPVPEPHDDTRFQLLRT